jgi:hypothetical protein
VVFTAMKESQGAAVYKPPTHKIGDFKSPLLEACSVIFDFCFRARLKRIRFSA